MKGLMAFQPVTTGRVSAVRVPFSELPPMPVLPNHKRERYAQALAAGETADAAYMIAGFSKNRSNAARLKADPEVATRVREIQDAICEGVIIERRWVLEQLQSIASAKFGHANVSVAEKRKALVDIARIEGWIIDKHELSGGLKVTHEEALEQLR